MAAREFFESVREASRDVALCRRQLDASERRICRVAAPSLDAHVSGGDRDVLCAVVVDHVAREAALHRRIEEDYRLIDQACRVLYGADGVHDGLASIAPTWWADALYYFYVQLRTWAEAGALLGYSPAHVRRASRAAFELLDANGMIATVAGVGMAERTA